MVSAGWKFCSHWTPELSSSAEAYGIATSDFSNILDDVLSLKCRDIPILMTTIYEKN